MYLDYSLDLRSMEGHLLKKSAIRFESVFGFNVFLAAKMTIAAHALTE